MKAFVHLILLSIPLCLVSCASDSNQAPSASSSAPPGFPAMIELIDWEHEELSSAAAALEAGDTLMATSLLLDHFQTHLPIRAPHMSYPDPIAEADYLISGHLQLPGHDEAELPADPSWAEDPFGDGNWRFQYHSFRWTMPLLQAYELSGERLYLERLMFLMEDYARDNLVQNPPSSLTWYDHAASLRTEHWLYIWRQLLISDDVDVEFMIRFLGWIHVHGYMLAFDINYQEDNNHGTYHNRALIVAGLVLPELEAASAWFSLGWQRLDAQIRGMVSPHGVDLEQSPSYHFSMFHLSLGIQALLQESGLSLSPPTLDVLAGMPIFAAHVLKPSGLLPMLSDTALDIQVSRWSGLDPVLDFSIFQGQAGTRPDERFLSYPVTGYVIMRSGWGMARPFSEETHAVFDTGPLGSWHGHHDALTFTLSAYGEDLVVDSGYYTYNSDDWRSYFTSPEAHNVVLPALNPDPDWSATPERLIWRVGDSWAYQSALVELTDRRDWVRHLVYLDPGDILLLDFTYGDGDPEIELLLHFPPGAQITAEGSNLRLQSNDAHLDVFCLFDPELSLVSGQEDPKRGWYSPRYGVKEANPVASFKNSGRRLDFITFLHPHEGDNPIQAFSLEEEASNDYLRFRIERSLFTEIVTVWTATGRIHRELVLDDER